MIENKTIEKEPLDVYVKKKSSPEMSGFRVELTFPWSSTWSPRDVITTRRARLIHVRIAFSVAFGWDQTNQNASKVSMRFLQRCLLSIIYSVAMFQNGQKNSNDRLYAWCLLGVIL